MTQDRAIDPGSIVIDNKPYWLSGGRSVRLFDAAQTPGKITIGEASAADNPNASEWNIDDGRGGIGVEIMEPSQDADRVWWADVDLRRKGRFFLQRRAIATSNNPANDIGTLTEFKNEMYASFSTAVHIYNNTTDTWGSSVRTLSAAATDAKRGLVGGVDTLVIATTTELDYTTDGAAWSRNTLDIKYVVFWNDLLWGIDQAGQLYYTDDLSADWSPDAQLQMPDDYITGLDVYIGADNEEHLLAITKAGVVLHDNINQKFFQPKDLKFPFHPNAGQKTEIWRGSLWYSAGNAMYKIQFGETTLVIPVGPDQDHGLPQSRRGVIIQTLGSFNDLIVLMDSSEGDGVSAVEARVSRGVGKHHGFSANSDLGFSQILEYNERAWQARWVTDVSSKPISAGAVANAYSTYRLWWAENQTVYYSQLPTDAVNPLQVPTSEYQPSGTLETPYNDMGIRNQVKTALDVLVETDNPTTDETIKVEYALNYTDVYTVLANDTFTDGVINTTGETKFRLSSDDLPIGVNFRAIRFRVTFNRGDTVTNTPQLIKLTLVWDAVVDVIYGISAALDVREDSPDGRNTEQQVLDLNSAFAKGTLSEVTYKNDTTESQNYYMRMRDLQSLEQTGEESTYGVWNVTMVEPRQSRDRT